MFLFWAPLYHLDFIISHLDYTTLVNLNLFSVEPKLIAPCYLCCSIEICPCLDPGYSVQKTMRSKFSLGEDKDAGLSKYMCKGLPLPINTFAGILTWHGGVTPQRNFGNTTGTILWLIAGMVVCLFDTRVPVWHMQRLKESPLSHAELFLKPTCFSLGREYMEKTINHNRQHIPW